MNNVVNIIHKAKEGDVISSKDIGTTLQIAIDFLIVDDNNYKLAQTINNIFNEISILDENDNEMIVGKFDTNNLVN